ncbi:hypothetical protein TanjilG_02263 [Lupinus angustifolius]|uniref:Uncharacterized protein n=1 Tax=Lupinus angustifolius TaxID=3871 RepID=A0A4P1QQH0_LUPAN|nr:hypothetical protein TanjilG_02263 [Lupinus angustifolius]
MMNPVDNINLYNSHQMGYDSLLPLSATTTADNIFRPPCNTFIAADSFPQKTAMNSDSSLTYNVHNCDSFSFLGEDLSLHLQKQQQQQLNINNIISEQIEKLKMEVVEKRKRETRKIMETIEVSVMKRVKAKENEIEKIGNLNYGLEEKVKSLCMENKTWRNLAQSNEATANALRNILEQVLTHANGGATINHAGATVPASSCCGSTDGVKNKEKDKDGVWRRIIGCAGVKDKEDLEIK